MKNLFLAGLMALSLGLSACAHKHCGGCCQHSCKDGSCKMEQKESCKDGCKMKQEGEKKAEDKK